MLQQLSAQDASFLYMDTPTTPMHVGSAMILDPSKSPYGPMTLELALKFYEERLHLMPMARRRLVHVQFGLDHPYWIEDPDFDLEYHIREVGLPEPHDWRQFYTLCARILGRPLDLTRPPWEVYIVHGLDKLDGIPSGSIAVLTKTHHCAIDGASGVDMLMAMSDLTPEMAPVEPPKRPWQGDPVPSDIELMTRFFGNSLLRPIAFADLLAQALPVQQRFAATASSRAQPPAKPIPKTRFNAPVSSHRVIGGRRFPLDEVRAMKNVVKGATVNDVVLAVCGGALRTYLEAKHELPSESMVAMAPVNLRKETKDGLATGNQVGALFIAIGTDIADPLERLRSVQSLTHQAKEISNAVRADLMTRLSEFVPAATANLAARLTAESARANQAAPAFNCSITNVPGPQVPLFSMGCETVTIVGYGPISDNMGLIMPVSSYYGELSIGFTSCRDMIPDPDFFMECIQDSFDAMKAAALGDNVETAVAAIAKNYEQMAERALEEVRSARARALRGA
jgi:WS/DGAT/MGAT family acyltransferase